MPSLIYTEMKNRVEALVHYSDALDGCSLTIDNKNTKAKRKYTLFPPNKEIVGYIGNSVSVVLSS